MCNKACVNPVTCKKIPYLKGVPVVWGKTVVDIYNNRTELDLPVACKCVPKIRPRCVRNKLF